MFCQLQVLPPSSLSWLTTARLLQRMAAPKGTQEPEIPEAPGYAETPVDPIVINPSKHLTHAECLE